MEPNNIELYCTQCEKLYIVKKEDLSLMLAFYQDSLFLKNEKYNFEGGCFFKELALLKRKQKKIS